MSDNSFANSLLNLYDKSCSYFLQPLTTSIRNDNTLVLIDKLDEIIKSLDAIAQNLTPAPLWHVLLDPGMVFVTSLGMLGMQWYSNKNERNKRREERKLQELKEIEGAKNQETGALNTAIAGLIDIKIVLLILKGQFIQERYQNVKQFKAELDNAVSKSESKNTIEEKLQEMMKWYNAIATQGEYKVFFEFIPNQHINHPYYPDELAFIAKSHPQYLLSLYKVHSFIKGIDEFIDKYNKVLQDKIDRYQAQNFTAESILVTHDLFLSSINNLSMILDDALWFVQDSYECLEKYAIRHGLEINTKLIKEVTTKYDNLMPDKDIHKSYREMIERLDV